MKKHKKSKMKEGSAAEEAMESPQVEAAEGGMKRGGKAKKKSVKAEGGKAKARLDKPMKRATGGKVMDSTDAGVSPSSPLATSSPQRKSGGKV